jgi:hypothetical protein
MEIRVVQQQPAAKVKMSPAELARGRKCVTVEVTTSITLEGDDFIVTYGPGIHECPTEISNVLWEQGAELVGADIKRSAPKPKGRFPGPTRGGTAGSIRFAI